MYPLDFHQVYASLGFYGKPLLSCSLTLWIPPMPGLQPDTNIPSQSTPILRMFASLILPKQLGSERPFNLYAHETFTFLFISLWNQLPPKVVMYMWNMYTVETCPREWFHNLHYRISTRLSVDPTRPTIKPEYLNQLRIHPKINPLYHEDTKSKWTEALTLVTCSHNRTKLFLLHRFQCSTTIIPMMVHYFCANSEYSLIV